MAQPYLDSIILQRLEIDGPGCTLALDDGEKEATFRVRFEDAHGIRVLTGADDLTRWLMTRGKLWALPRIRALLDSASAGRFPALPHQLEDDRTEPEECA